FKKAVENSGYSINPGYKSITFKVLNMSCASCAQTVSGVLSKMDGVKEANLNFASEKAKVVYDSKIVSPFEMKKEVEAIDYKLVEQKSGTADGEQIKEFKKAESRARLAWFITGPIALWMIPEMLFGITLAG
nr:cation transporter [Elusimicrobiota bacterium]